MLLSGLQRHRSCHSNEMTLLPILLAAVYLGTGNCSSKIVYGSFSLQQWPQCSWSLSKICKSVIEIFWDEVFMVRNMVKNRQSWCLAVICRKWGAFNLMCNFNSYINMKLGDNTLNNERLSLVKTKFLTKYYRIVALILLPYNLLITLKLKGHIKGRLISNKY